MILCVYELVKFTSSLQFKYGKIEMISLIYLSLKKLLIKYVSHTLSQKDKPSKKLKNILWLDIVNRMVTTKSWYDNQLAESYRMITWY